MCNETGGIIARPDLVAVTQWCQTCQHHQVIGWLCWKYIPDWHCVTINGRCLECGKIMKVAEYRSDGNPSEQQVDNILTESLTMGLLKGISIGVLDLIAKSRKWAGTQDQMDFLKAMGSLEAEKLAMDAFSKLQLATVKLGNAIRQAAIDSTGFKAVLKSLNYFLAKQKEPKKGGQDD